MNLKNWISQGRAHWKEHLPTRYRQLQEAGTLERSLKAAAEQTYLEVSELEDSGFQPDEAWQMVREKYLLLPPEGTPTPTEQPNLMHEMPLE
jgi:hypothetical protein